MGITVFKSTTQLKEGMQVDCESRGKNFILDEPEGLGGKDTGMNPVEALLSALGACKCIAARYYAKAHGIDLKDIRVEVEGDLDLDGFKGEDEDAKMGFTAIRTKLYIDSDASEEKLKEFVNFIDRTSPVADTLENPPKLETEFVAM